MDLSVAERILTGASAMTIRRGLESCENENDLRGYAAVLSSPCTELSVDSLDKGEAGSAHQDCYQRGNDGVDRQRETVVLDVRRTALRRPERCVEGLT